MTELEGPRELRDLAETAHKFVKGYMTRKCIHEPPMVFFTKQGIVIPDPKDIENAPRVFQRILELAGKCYAKTFIARLRNEDGDVVHEDALVTIAGDGGNFLYHCADPFTYVKRENRVVEIRWEEDSGSWRGWQSRSENIAHIQTLSPQQQRMLDYISAESGMEWKSDDCLRHSLDAIEEREKRKGSDLEAVIWSFPSRTASQIQNMADLTDSVRNPSRV